MHFHMCVCVCVCVRARAYVCVMHFHMRSPPCPSTANIRTTYSHSAPGRLRACACARTHFQWSLAAKVAPGVGVVVALLLVDWTRISEMRSITLVARAFGVLPIRVRTHRLTSPSPRRRANRLAHFCQHPGAFHLALVGCREALERRQLVCQGGGARLGCTSAIFVGPMLSIRKAAHGEEGKKGNAVGKRRW